MKSCFLILICLLCITGAYASGLVKLCGTITNPLSDTVTVYFDNGGVFYDKREFKAAIDKDGRFALRFEVPHLFTQVFIKNGQQATELFTAEGMDLNLTIDGKNFDSSLRYDGKGKELANFMAKHLLERGISIRFTGPLSELMGGPSEAFEAELKKITEKEFAFYEQNKAGLPPGFESYWKNYYTYIGYRAMLKYPFFHQMFKQNSMSFKVVASKESFGIVDHVPFVFDDSLVELSSYKDYALNYFLAKLSGENVQNGQVNSPDRYRLDDSVLQLLYSKTPTKTAELAIGTTLYSGSVAYDTARNLQLLVIYKQHFPQSPNLAILERKMLGLKKLSPGLPAPDFSFKTVDGKEMKLSDLKGKVVVLDFWASWCGPCLAQVPAAKKLEDHFKDKNVVFLKISIDEDLDKWRGAIKKLNMGGIHTCFTQGWQSSVAKQYVVNSIPAYFLIDTNGNMAIANCPTPDQGDELRKEIEKLLH
jgi:thiol-disulfide isomerase/thioredoxin